MKTLLPQALVFFLVINLLLVDQVLGQDSKQPTANAELELHSVGSWGLELKDRDSNVKPGDDFYMSQNGAWFAQTELTPERPFAAYWNDLRRMIPRRLSAILSQLPPSSPPDSVEGRAGAFYRAFMDVAAAESKGVAPLNHDLDAIRTVKTRKQLAAMTGVLAGPWTTRGSIARIRPTNRAFWGVTIAQDQENTDRYAVYVGQAGLGMPGPEYYSDPHLADIKAAYEKYVAKALTLIGWPGAEGRAKQIVALESSIAEVSWSHEQMLDPVTTYNPITVVQLRKLAPQFDWTEFFSAAGVAQVSTVVIDAKSAFPKLAQIYGETDLEVLKAQQAFVLVDQASLLLNDAVFKANHDFWGKMFNSQSAVPRPRSFYAWTTLEDSIGDLLGVLYVQKYFSPESKTKAVEMAVNMKAAFDARLERASWLSPATRAKAREKLAKMTMNIGYPDKIQDYSGLQINDKDLYGDVRRASVFRWRQQLKRLNTPFDRSLWNFTPEWVSYNYSPTKNTLEIPAGTFQPPFFDLHADPAVNYGSVGVMIGAMMAAGFDDQGRHYDADGHLRDWWTEDEIKFFKAKRQELSNQYSAIEPLPGIHIKGELVVDEAIQDLSGWLIALDAYRLSLKGQPAQVLDGLTGDQRVFLGRAQMWRAKFPPDFVRNQLATGRNAMPFLRVNGPVRNMDEWYDSFDVKPGEKMYLPPDKRVHIW